MLSEKNARSFDSALPNNFTGSIEASQQGQYHLQAAKISSDATIKAARIGARARYFHGISAMITAFGVFGAFAYKLYEENQQIRITAEKIQNDIKSQDSILQELVQAYERLVEQSLETGNKQENEEFRNKVIETKKRKQSTPSPE